MADLLPVREAQARILAVISPLEGELIHFSAALGRVIYDDLTAPYDLPIFSNSSMDGYALIASDSAGAAPEHPVVLSVIGDIPAGAAPGGNVKPGAAYRIMTGAPIPSGADAVVPIEDTLADAAQINGLPDSVSILHPARSGQYIRNVGQDAQLGQKIFPRGHRLTPPDIGLLTMLGIIEVPVYKTPRVAILSSGDELVQPHEPLSPGKIRDANTYMLAAMVRQFGGDVVYTGIAKDTYQAVHERFDEAVELNPDIILSSAGVSVGAFDYIRSVVEDQGHLSFWRVNMRPGKPVAFGSYREIPVVGLPGNPVSAFVGFLVFVRPVLNRLAGVQEESLDLVKVKLAEPVESDGRESYLRAVITQVGNDWQARLAGNQGSGNLLSIVQANALLIVPSGVKSLPAGSSVDAWMFRAGMSGIPQKS